MTILEKPSMKTRNALIAVGAATVLLVQTGFPQSGSVDTTFMHRIGPDGAVNALVVQPDGMVVFGGAFLNVNFTPQNGLARADTNGNVDASFAIGTGPDSTLNALALQDDGKILVAGAFSYFNGAPCPGITRLNSDGSLDTSFVTGAGADGPVYYVAWQANGEVLIQGAFSNYNGTPRLGLARLNADGSLDTSFDPGDRAASVTAIAWQADGKVVLSGSFDSLDGIDATNIARLNDDGSLDTNFCAAASVDNAASSLALQPDGRILLGGFFDTVDGVARRRIARLNTDGTLDLSFDPGSGFAGLIRIRTGYIHLAVQPNGEILAWGIFSSFNGTNCDGVALLTSTGGLDSTFNPSWGASGVSPNAVAFLANGQFVTGSSSGSFGYLTRRDSDGTRDMTWMNEVGTDDSLVNCVIEQPDGKVVLGGWFGNVNGVPEANLARLNADGSVDTGFTANTSGSTTIELWETWSCPVVALALQADGKILVGGTFTAINGLARTNLARLNADGSVDAGFVANCGSSGYSGVVALALQPDGKVLVGGYFEEINGVAITNLARLNPDGSVDGTFQSGTDGAVLALALQPDGMILIGGQFNNVNGFPQSLLARLYPNGRLDTSFTSGSWGLPPQSRRQP
jgi:uncharacterized delta-60 repeat protein